MGCKIMPDSALEDTVSRLDGFFALLVAVTTSASVSVVPDSALSALTDLLRVICDDFQANIAAAEDCPEGGPQSGGEQ